MNNFGLDWNWFFSSISQCGAAIIGIIGGFVISQIINSNNKHSDLVEEFKDLEIKFQYILKESN